jgi:hypothetical protein
VPNNKTWETRVQQTKGLLQTFVKHLLKVDHDHALLVQRPGPASIAPRHH